MISTEASLGLRRLRQGLSRDNGRQDAGYRAAFLKPFAYSSGELTLRTPAFRAMVSAYI